jgi:hypothetical protein
MFVVKICVDWSNVSSVKKEISDANFVLQTGERVPASCEMSIERLLLISSSISLPVITI